MRINSNKSAEKIQTFSRFPCLQIHTLSCIHNFFRNKIVKSANTLNFSIIYYSKFYDSAIGFHELWNGKMGRMEKINELTSIKNLLFKTN